MRPQLTRTFKRASLIAALSCATFAVQAGDTRARLAERLTVTGTPTPDVIHGLWTSAAHRDTEDGPATAFRMRLAPDEVVIGTACEVPGAPNLSAFARAPARIDAQQLHFHQSDAHGVQMTTPETQKPRAACRAGIQANRMLACAGDPADAAPPGCFVLDGLRLTLHGTDGRVETLRKLSD